MHTYNIAHIYSYISYKLICNTTSSFGCIACSCFLMKSPLPNKTIQVWPIYKFLVLASRRHLGSDISCEDCIAITSHVFAMPKLFVPVSFLFFFFLNFTFSHDVMWRGVTGWWLLLLVFNILKSLFESEDHQYGSTFWNLPKRQWNWQKYIVFLAWHISFFVDERCLAIAPS